MDGKLCLVASSCLCLNKHLHLYYNSIVGFTAKPGVKIVVAWPPFGCHFPAACTIVESYVRTELGVVVMLLELTYYQLVISTKLRR
jgi:hypothetical protein